MVSSSSISLVDRVILVSIVFSHYSPDLYTYLLVLGEGQSLGCFLSSKHDYPAALDNSRITSIYQVV